MQATVNFGRGEDGVYFLAVVEDKKIKVKFELLPHNVWHRFYDAGGNLIEDKGLTSLSYTLEYLRILEKLMDSELEKDSKYIIEKIAGMNSVRPVNTTSTGDAIVSNVKPEEKKVDTSSDLNIDDLF